MIMTRAPYRRYVTASLVAAAALALFLWLITPARWFGFYGPATALLASSSRTSRFLCAGGGGEASRKNNNNHRDCATHGVILRCVTTRARLCALR